MRFKRGAKLRHLPAVESVLNHICGGESVAAIRFISIYSKKQKSGRTHIARSMTTISLIGYDNHARSASYHLIARSIRQGLASLPTRMALLCVSFQPSAEFGIS